MGIINRSLGRGLAVVGTAFYTFLPPAAMAEITLDGSMGPGGPLTGPDYVIGQELGQTVGNNLFHSFDVFNINTGESATFTGAANIQNIIGRVTGGSGSFIDGRLASTIPGADLYLVNPNGVVFGQNASLDVGGSFYATTADYLRLGDGGRFDATQPASTVLSVAPPSAFGFLDADVASIAVQGSNLSVAPGETLALVGGDIEVRGNNTYIDLDAGDPATLEARSGNLALVGVAAAGEVIRAGEGYDVSGFSTLGDVAIRDGAAVVVDGDPAGTVYIRGGNLVIENSQVLADTEGAVDHSGNAIDIAINGRMSLRATAVDYTNETTLQASTRGAGRAGDIRIRAGELDLEGDMESPEVNEGEHDAVIASRASSTGRSGDIDIEVDRLDMGDRTRIVTQSFGAGDSGDIRITAGEMNVIGLTDSAFVSTSAFSSGNAGDLTVNAGRLTLRGGNQFVGLASQVTNSSNAAANGGQLRVTAGELNILDGAEINAGVFSGSGRGGDIQVQADRITISGISNTGNAAGIYATTSGFYTTGDAGTITITAGTLDMAAGGKISTTSFSFGDAGGIRVDADTVRIRGANIANASTGLFAVAGLGGGVAGDITINAKNLSLLDGGIINNQTVGPGNGGNISIHADSVVVAGRDEVNDLSSSILASTAVYWIYDAYATGNGGDINIDAGRLEVRDGGLISAASHSQGDGGSVNIDAGNVVLANGGMISADSTRTGNAGSLRFNVVDTLALYDGVINTSAEQADGGNITIRAGRMLYLEGGEITTSVKGGTGNGGNINIDPEFVVLNNGTISANAFGGNGGNIEIVADNFIVSADSSISASSRFGLDGSVIVRAPNQDIGNELALLPEQAEDAASRFKRHCVSESARFSSFVTAGRVVTDLAGARPAAGVYPVIRRAGGNGARVSAPASGGAPPPVARESAAAPGCAG